MTSLQFAVCSMSDYSFCQPMRRSRTTFVLGFAFVIVVIGLGCHTTQCADLFCCKTFSIWCKQSLGHINAFAILRPSVVIASSASWKRTSTGRITWVPGSGSGWCGIAKVMILAWSGEYRPQLKKNFTERFAFADLIASAESFIFTEILALR